MVSDSIIRQQQGGRRRSKRRIMFIFDVGDGRFMKCNVYQNKNSMSLIYVQTVSSLSAAADLITPPSV